jgi:hypothetical protein
MPAWLSRISSPTVVSYLRPDIAAETMDVLRTVKLAPPELLMHERPNRDLFPRDEFATPAHR